MFVICTFKPTDFCFSKNMRGTERYVVSEDKYINVNATFRDFSLSRNNGAA